MLFRNIIYVACLSALIAGVVLGLLQSFSSSEIIFAAEKYEVSASLGESSSQHEHAGSESHGHEGQWKPADGIERLAYTFISDIFIAFGHSLLLISFMLLVFFKYGKPEITWRSGMIIGIAGYLSFYLATTMGLAPEIPGTITANLQARQIWWVLTVMATATGLMVIYLAANGFKLVGLLLIALPHIFGAPQPLDPGFLNSELTAVTALRQLEHQFLLSTLWVNFIYWVALGAFSGLFLQRRLISKNIALSG